MAFLKNSPIQVYTSLRNTNTIFGQVSVQSFPVATALAKYAITNPDTTEISYTLLGLFTDFFIENALIKSAGKVTPVISLLVTLQIPNNNVSGQVNTFDMSDQVVGDVSINWPEDSAGSASVKFSVMRDLEDVSETRNPFEIIPTTEGTSPIQIGSKIIIRSRIDYGDPVQFTFSHTIFTGRIATMAFEASSHSISVSCVDMSYDISRPSSRISRDYLAIQDSQFEEIPGIKLLDADGQPNVSFDSTGTGSHTFVELSLKYARATSDLKLFALAGNGLLATPTDFGAILLTETSALVSEVAPENTETRKNIILIDVTATDGIFNHYLTRANPPTVWRVGYEVGDNDTLQLLADAPQKSAIIETILQDTLIDTFDILHKDSIEDEITLGNIAANREFPLDFIKKIIVPQTWYARYNPYGSLKIGRDVLIEKPQLTFSEVTILDNTLSIKKSVSDVINTQEVSGILVSTPPGATLPSPTSPPTPHGPRTELVKVGSVFINVQSEAVIPRYGQSLDLLTPGLFTNVVLVACNLNTVAPGKQVDGGLFFGSKFGQTGSYLPKLVIKSDSRNEQIGSLSPSGGSTSIVDNGTIPNLSPARTLGMTLSPGWFAYLIKNNDFNAASYGTNWSFSRQDIFNRNIGSPDSSQIQELQWFVGSPLGVLPTAFDSTLVINDLSRTSNKPRDGLFSNTTTPTNVVDLTGIFFAVVTISRAMTLDKDSGSITLNAYSADVEIWVRVKI